MHLFISKNKSVKSALLSFTVLITSLNSGCGLIVTTSSGTSIRDSDFSISDSLNVSENISEETNNVLLKNIYKDFFSFGAAVVNSKLNLESNTYFKMLENFDSITAEYEMKWKTLEPVEGEYNYDYADTIISWAKENDASVRGHCLLWYKSLPTWLKDKEFTKNSGLKAIDKHVKETMKYFGNNVFCWDVLNEALKSSISNSDLENGTIYRTGEMNNPNEYDWYSLSGVDYIKQAFKSANEAKEEYNLVDIDLFYNDFGLENPNKREACLEMIKTLQENNIKIDGIGIQGHYRLPTYLKDKELFLTRFEDSIKTFTELGLDVHVTELDVRVYENDEAEEKYGYKLPSEIAEQQAELYGEIIRICRNYSKPWKEGSGRVSNVTIWGVSDDKNSWDTEAHVEHPLLFDREHNPKEAFYAISSL